MDIIRALRYWQKVGLLTMEEDASGHICGINLLPMPETETVSSQTPVAESAKVIPEAISPAAPVYQTPAKRRYTADEILNFRKMAKAGITKDDIRAFCDAVYAYVPEGTYFSAQMLRTDGFETELYDLGFSDWFYANLLISDDRFSYTNVFGNLRQHRTNATIRIIQQVPNKNCG